MTHEGATPSHKCRKAGAGTDMVRNIGVDGKSAQQRATVVCTDAARVPLTVPRPSISVEESGWWGGAINPQFKRAQPTSGEVHGSVIQRRQKDCDYFVFPQHSHSGRGNVHITTQFLTLAKKSFLGPCLCTCDFESFCSASWFPYISAQRALKIKRPKQTDEGSTFPPVSGTACSLYMKYLSNSSAG